MHFLFPLLPSLSTDLSDEALAKEGEGAIGSRTPPRGIVPDIFHLPMIIHKVKNSGMTQKKERHGQ